PQVASCSDCASGILDADSVPTVWNGTPTRRASWPQASTILPASGVPKVGAPLCIEMVLAKEPIRHGAPGLISWTSDRQASASARTCASVPATVHGLIAPASVHGVQATGWLLRAQTFSEPDMLASRTSGALVLL